ncbi:MAG: hypothetical protein AB8B86_09575 [Pseudomonadales bacterium]
MLERGLDLTADSPPTIFSFAEQKYDYVVTLCSEETQENYKVLYDVAKLLFADQAEIIHWNVADFMAIKAQSPEMRAMEAAKIIDDINSRILDWTASLHTA